MAFQKLDGNWNDMSDEEKAILFDSISYVPASSADVLSLTKKVKLVSCYHKEDTIHQVIFASRKCLILPVSIASILKNNKTNLSSNLDVSGECEDEMVWFALVKKKSETGYTFIDLTDVTKEITDPNAEYRLWGSLDECISALRKYFISVETASDYDLRYYFKFAIAARLSSSCSIAEEDDYTYYKGLPSKLGKITIAISDAVKYDVPILGTDYTISLSGLLSNGTYNSTQIKFLTNGTYQIVY